MEVAIDRRHTVRLPSERVTQVNAFDFNLAWLADGWVQLTDTGWIRARSCVIVSD